MKQYHADNYRPRNTLIVVSGTADEHEFLAALEKVDQRIRCKPLPPAASRPWSGDVPPVDLTANGVLVGASGVPKEIAFPSEDESVGSISLAWRGPLFEVHSVSSPLCEVVE